MTTKRRISKGKRLKVLDAIKTSTPKIVFKAKNIIVTLRNRKQLSRWLELYPNGSYTIN